MFVDVVGIASALLRRQLQPMRLSRCTLRVRRFASSNGFRPTREFLTPVWGQIWTRSRPGRQVKRLQGAYEGSWKGNAISFAVLCEPHEEEGNYDYLSATGPLGTSLEPTAIGHRWLVRGRCGPPLDTGIPPIPSPRRLREFEAYHRQIEVRSEDERWGPVLARSRAITWFQESDPVALAFEVPTPHLLVAVGSRGAWGRDVDGFLDALIEFRDILTDVLRPSISGDR